MERVIDFVADLDRINRTGLEEAVLCEYKEIKQIEKITENAIDAQRRQLLTRLKKSQYLALREDIQSEIDYEEISQTGIIGDIERPEKMPAIGIVSAGTSDIGVAREAFRTLLYHVYSSEEIYDVGVAGLWRLLQVLDRLKKFNVLIVVAGMDAALPSVVAGLVPSAVIAVPTSVGYGVATDGHAALHAILASCAPGITTVNIDNGYGAACAAIRILQQKS